MGTHFGKLFHLRIDWPFLHKLDESLQNKDDMMDKLTESSQYVD